MSAAVFILLILIGIAAVFYLVAVSDGRSRSSPRSEAERDRQDAELSTFLFELHRQNRETYRRIKEAGRMV